MIRHVATMLCYAATAGTGVLLFVAWFCDIRLR